MRKNSSVILKKRRNIAKINIGVRMSGQSVTSEIIFCRVYDGKDRGAPIDIRTSGYHEGDIRGRRDVSQQGEDSEGMAAKSADSNNCRPKIDQQNTLDLTNYAGTSQNGPLPNLYGCPRCPASPNSSPPWVDLIFTKTCQLRSSNFQNWQRWHPAYKNWYLNKQSVHGHD